MPSELAGIVRLRIAWHRAIQWRGPCRHCGAPVMAFRISPKRRRELRADYPDASPGSHERLRGKHYAHVYGEAHCEAPCPRTALCRCLPLEDDE